VVETFGVDEERAPSPLVVEPPATAGVTPERPMFGVDRRTLLPGVGWTGLGSKFGTVFDLWTGLFEELWGC